MKIIYKLSSLEEGRIITVALEKIIQNNSWYEKLYELILKAAHTNWTHINSIISPGM